MLILSLKQPVKPNFDQYITEVPKYIIKVSMQSLNIAISEPGFEINDWPKKLKMQKIKTAGELDSLGLESYITTVMKNQEKENSGRIFVKFDSIILSVQKTISITENLSIKSPCKWN